jgi:hypothetical protein
LARWSAASRFPTVREPTASATSRAPSGIRRQVGVRPPSGTETRIAGVSATKPVSRQYRLGSAISIRRNSAAASDESAPATQPGPQIAAQIVRKTAAFRLWRGIVHADTTEQHHARVTVADV